MADSKISQISPKGGLDVYDLDQDFLPVAKNNGVDGNRKYSLRNIKEAVDDLIPWNLTTTPDVLPVTAMPGSFLEVTVAGDYLTTTFEVFDLGIVSSDGVNVIRIPFLVASESFVSTSITAALAAYTPTPAQVITYTTSRTSIGEDNGKWIRYDSGTDVTYSIDQEGTYLALGDEIHIEQIGVGKVTIDVALPAYGTIVNESNFLPKTRGARAVLTIKKTVHGATRANDIFTVFGGLATV